MRLPFLSVLAHIILLNTDITKCFSTIFYHVLYAVFFSQSGHLLFLLKEIGVHVGGALSLFSWCCEHFLLFQHYVI